MYLPRPPKYQSRLAATAHGHHVFVRRLAESSRNGSFRLCCSVLLCFNGVLQNVIIRVCPSRARLRPSTPTTGRKLSTCRREQYALRHLYSCVTCLLEIDQLVKLRLGLLQLGNNLCCSGERSVKKRQSTAANSAKTSSRAKVERGSAGANLLVKADLSLQVGFGILLKVAHSLPLEVANLAQGQQVDNVCTGLHGILLATAGFVNLLAIPRGTAKLSEQKKLTGGTNDYRQGTHNTRTLLISSALDCADLLDCTASPNWEIRDEYSFRPSSQGS